MGMNAAFLKRMWTLLAGIALAAAVSRAAEPPAVTAFIQGEEYRVGQGGDEGDNLIADGRVWRRWHDLRVEAEVPLTTL